MFCLHLFSLRSDPETSKAFLFPSRGKFRYPRVICKRGPGGGGGEALVESTVPTKIVTLAYTQNSLVYENS